MNNYLFVFDIDGTICPINKPLSISMNSILRKIAATNYLVLASGKPFGYIAGFCRQLELVDAIIIGENGATIAEGAGFPPEKYFKTALSYDLNELFSEIRREFENTFRNSIWFQPNDVILTIFPMDIRDIGRIHGKAKEYQSKKMQTYFHEDCVDFVPVGINKGLALERLMGSLNIEREKVYVFGDGHNDIPMFEKAGHIITIGDLNLTIEAERKIASVKELEQFLEKLIA